LAPKRRNPLGDRNRFAKRGQCTDALGSYDPGAGLTP
jgi:hypothetical protein